MLEGQQREQALGGMRNFDDTAADRQPKSTQDVEANVARRGWWAWYTPVPRGRGSGMCDRGCAYHSMPPVAGRRGSRLFGARSSPYPAGQVLPYLVPKFVLYRPR